MNIYVACPHAYVTGGIELLHQLVHELNKHNCIEAKIWYVGTNIENPQPKEYDIYGNEYIVTDTPPSGSTLVFPEIWADMVNQKQFESYHKIIYWESVDNYVSRNPDYKNKKFLKDILHLAQSHYAYVFLTSEMGISADKVVMVTDYINDDFLAEYGQVKRSRIVLYNPNKGLEYTKKIIDQMNDTLFIPLQNMSRKDMIHTMHSSMLYLDFGNHPGKDRMPRESAICGCCVLTSMLGSAKYFEDVGIPEEYKFDCVEDNIPVIVDKITTILDNYDKITYDFDEYRDKIRKEHMLFSNQVSELVEKLWIPKFSIVIPAHNEANNISKALDSIKSQKFTDYEVLVICDACDDNTKEIADSYGARTFEVNYHRDGLTRNVGIDNAQGEWLMFMDADDWYLHEFVFSLLDEKVGQEGEDVLLFALIWKHIGYGPVRSRDGRIFTHSVNKCWRRNVIGNTRFPDSAAGSDSEFWDAMVKKGIKMVEWDMPLYYYNYLREGSISANFQRTVSGTKAYWGFE